MFKRFLIVMIVSAITRTAASWWGSSGGVHQEGIINTLVEKSELSNSERQEIAFKLVIGLLQEVIGLLRGIMVILGALLLAKGIGYIARTRRGLPPTNL